LKATQKQLIKTMQMLRDNKMVPNGRFAEAGILRYSHCIDRLRKDYGVGIETITPRKGPTPELENTWWYRLDFDPWCECDLEGPHRCRLHWPDLSDHIYEQEKDRRMMP